MCHNSKHVAVSPPPMTDMHNEILQMLQIDNVLHLLFLLMRHKVHPFWDELSLLWRMHSL